jgi:hypothetical protein
VRSLAPTVPEDAVIFVESFDIVPEEELKVKEPWPV